MRRNKDAKKKKAEECFLDRQSGGESANGSGILGSWFSRGIYMIKYYMSIKINIYKYTIYIHIRERETHAHKKKRV